MTTSPLSRLNAALSGRYRIERELGAGGMAAVYLADDLRHERKVALKVLKPELAAVVGAERFLAEIKTTANLQHPHILPLFDSGEVDGLLFYVMPFVEGESLRDRLDREHQLPVDDAVRIATNVAEALDYAHRQGVIHRDIKPANVLLLDGKPVISDFGIALAVSAAGGGRLTETGLSLGTPFYMSPEQAAADREPTPATDVYSLGCVLYEMLVGEPPYTGSSAQAVLAKILVGDAPTARGGRPSVPPNVDAAIRKALERLPADRFPSGGELVRALRDPEFRHGEGARPESALEPGTRRKQIVPWVIAAAATALAVFSVLPRGEAPDTRRLALSMPDSVSIPLRPLLPLGTPQPAFDVSRDGSRLVHLGYDGEDVELYVRSLDSYESIPIPGTVGASMPFFSPDGEWVGFFQETQLKRVSLRGGSPEPITDATNPAGGYWTDDDRILFASNEGQLLQVVDASGGNEETMLSIRGGMFWVGGPQPVPGSDALTVTGSFPPEVSVYERGEGVPRPLTPGGSPLVLASGHILFGRRGTLFAAPFDVESLRILEEPQPVLEGVRQDGDITQYRVGADGTLYFVPGRDAARGVLVWAGPQGVDTLGLPEAWYQPMAVSPDGTQVAVMVWESSPEIWAYDVATGRGDRVAEGSGLTQPTWSRDGSAILYGAPRSGEAAPTRVVLHPLAGGSPSVLAEGLTVWVSDVSHDGRWVAYEDYGESGLGDLWMTPAEPGGEPVRYTDSPANEWGAVFSPDGAWVAFTSDVSGQYEIYVAPFPREESWYATRISAHDNSEEPRWSKDGREVIYRSGSRWWAVPVDLTGRPSSGAPRLVLEGPYPNVPGISWDLHPDGDRLLVIDAPRETTANRIHMIPNWTSELERLVPSGR